jgi:5-methylcytosine-specific restriction endonuclease McrA
VSPIRPEMRSLYPANWQAIALAVKEEAGWRCEHCGMQCRRPGERFDSHVRTLTVAHLDHDPRRSERENLRALCSGCHNRYDAQHRADGRRARRGRGTTQMPERAKHDA